MKYLKLFESFGKYEQNPENDYEYNIDYNNVISLDDYYILMTELFDEDDLTTVDFHRFIVSDKTKEVTYYLEDNTGIRGMCNGLESRQLYSMDNTGYLLRYSFLYCPKKIQPEWEVVDRIEINKFIGEDKIKPELNKKSINKLLSKIKSDVNVKDVRIIKEEQDDYSCKIRVAIYYKNSSASISK